MSETLKIGYVASSPSYPMGLNRPTSSLGADSCSKLYVGWDSYSLESKSLLRKCVCSHKLESLISDTIFQLMWDTKKSENILMYMYVHCPSTPPWTRLRYQYVLRSDAEGRLHVLRPFVSKLKQNAITMNSNNESKIFR